MKTIKYQKLNEAAKLPTRKHNSAGFDLYSCGNFEIQPHSFEMVPLGFATSFPTNLVALVYSKSGLACKHGITLRNKVAVIDADYRGEWMLCIINESDEPVTIEQGQAIAQLIFHKLPNIEFSVVDTLDETERGAGGFGSTGKF